MKIPNSFSSTIFNRHRIQYEAGAFLETDFSNAFSFLPATTDHIERINRYLNSVNLLPIDIELSEIGENFDPSKLDYANPGREHTRESVLRVLKEVADLGNQNLQRNSNGLLATKLHDNESLLWGVSHEIIFHKELRMFNCFCNYSGLSHHCTRKIKDTIKITSCPEDCKFCEKEVDRKEYISSR